MSSFFGRTKNGKLKCDSLDLEILFGEMFQEAKTEKEVEWIYECLESVIDIASEEAMVRINN
ncbi:hypothetical protein [Oceanobacillus sp. J11TS1]|uniref:hypothetical protein n=1 Tax=Oceanobacillus sp. J11TS1 TaxID=2807191 RepID=UPI001B25B882|nr:hypothetical protein [Oceanobacillus sp. J11TS1]GIO25116.1 hypothetical protein J11TS1_36970 [Oceanobacillus sp. J11TS1]